LARADLLAALGLLAVGASLGCSGPKQLEDGLAAAAQAVIGGTPDPNETGVVVVSHLDHPMLCSGTVIGPTLVVTAKHCTFKEVASGPDVALAGNRFRVGFGPKQGSLTYRLSTKMEWIGQPANVEVQPAVDSGEDVALIWLSSAVPTGTIIHKVKTDYTPGTADAFTIVGYGRSSLSSNASGTKLMTVDALVNVNGSTGIVKTQGKGACSGDSGGAFFFGAFPAGTQRELVGITSTAQKSATGVECGVGISNATSVRNPKVSQFLLDALGIVGVCVPAAEICGDNKDQDCDGIADNACKQDGASCSSSAECATGLCEDAGSGKICVRHCDDKTPCPSGSRCVASCDQGFCSPGAQGQKKLLESCADASECASNQCGASGCTTVCNPSLGQCPDDMACAGAAACGECAPLAGASGPRQLGEKCASAADCASDAQCVDDGVGVKRCSTPCLEGGGCPSGFVCHDDLCVRGGGLPTGERCMGAEYCASGACLTLPDPRNNFCTKACDPTKGCGDGFDCTKISGYDLCVPTGVRLGESCIADSQCLSGHCDASLGYCTRRCDPRTAPCPPGFECNVTTGELWCVDATTWVPSGGTGGSGGAQVGGSGGVSGSAAGGSGAGGASGGAGQGGSNDSASDSGGCALRRGSRSSLDWSLLVGLALLAARRRRSPGVK